MHEHDDAWMISWMLMRARTAGHGNGGGPPGHEGGRAEGDHHPDRDSDPPGQGGGAGGPGASEGAGEGGGARPHRPGGGAGRERQHELAAEQERKAGQGGAVEVGSPQGCHGVRHQQPRRERPPGHRGVQQRSHLQHRAVADLSRRPKIHPGVGKEARGQRRHVLQAGLAGGRQEAAEARERKGYH